MMTGNITVMARTMAQVPPGGPIMVRGLTTVGDPITMDADPTTAATTIPVTGIYRADDDRDEDEDHPRKGKKKKKDGDGKDKDRKDQHKRDQDRRDQDGRDKKEKKEKKEKKHKKHHDDD